MLKILIFLTMMILGLNTYASCTEEGESCTCSNKRYYGQKGVCTDMGGSNLVCTITSETINDYTAIDDCDAN